MIKVSEYGLEFGTVEEAVEFLEEKFVWRYGSNWEAEGYDKQAWIEDRIEEVEE